MHSSFALLLTTSLPFAGSAAAKDLWPKTASPPVTFSEELMAHLATDPNPEFIPPPAFLPDAVAA